MACLGGCLGASLATAVHGQTVETPAAIERTIPQRTTPAVAAPAPTIVSTPPVPEQEAVIGGSFVLGAVHIEGARALSPDILAQAYDPYLATRVDNAVLVRIAADITRRYRDAGYLLSRATVPPQSVASGIVLIEVTEGYIGDIEIEGAGDSRSAVLEVAAGLRDPAPLRAERLERVLGLIRDMPGVAISDARLQRATDDPARHILTIAVVGDRTDGLLFTDNRGPEPDARVRLYGSAGAASVLLAGDELRTDLFAMPGEDYRFFYGQTTYSLPLGHDGLRLGMQMSAGDQYQNLAPGKIDGTSRDIAAQLTYPLVRSRAFSVSAKLAINDWHSTSRLAGDLFQRDDLTVARIGLLAWSETATRFLAEMTLARGLGVDGTTRVGDPLSSNPRGGARFTKVSISAEAAVPLSPRWAARFAFAGQVSSAPLLSVEELALGGARIGRAYDFNSLTGDEGFGGSLELAHTFGDVIRHVRRLELFGFVDGGAVYQANMTPSPLSGNTLASVGGGSRFGIENVNLSIELGIPLNELANSRAIRGFLSLSRKF